MKFDWDPAKALLNVKNHGVSFEEAETAFADPLARIFDDEEHSFEEKRNAIFRHPLSNLLLIVSFTEREGDKIGLIRTRLATQRKVEGMQIELDENDDLLPEYDLDFSKSKPNRFAEKYNKTVTRVGLAPDAADKFTTEESMHEALRHYMRLAREPHSEATRR